MKSRFFIIELELAVFKILVSTCDYEYHGGSVDFKCLELVHGREMTRCMFHDINYLGGDNYEKNKEKVGKRFNISYQIIVLQVTFRIFWL